MLSLAAIIAGFILDLIFGDPHCLPHPICLIGNLIGYLDKKLRAMCGKNEVAQLYAGGLLVITVVSLSFLVPWSILTIAGFFSPWLKFVIETIFCYQIFATKCLKDESMNVYYPLKAHDIKEARVKLSWIVGRDTQELTEEQITKGAVETVA